MKQMTALMTPFNRRLSTFLNPPRVLSYVSQEEHWTSENKLCVLIIRDSEARFAQMNVLNYDLHHPLKLINNSCREVRRS